MLYADCARFYIVRLEAKRGGSAGPAQDGASSRGTDALISALALNSPVFVTTMYIVHTDAPEPRAVSLFSFIVRCKLGEGAYTYVPEVFCLRNSIPHLIIDLDFDK